MADFIPAIEYCLQNEGGFVNKTNDRGGPTNRGVTMSMLAKYKGRMVSIEELKNLSNSDVASFYDSLFWTPLKISGLKQSIATAILDTSINQGVASGVKLAQEALAPQVIADGIMGPETLKILDTINERDFMLAYIAVIQEKYARICMNAADQLEFLSGWLKRSRRLFTLIPF